MTASRRTAPVKIGEIRGISYKSQKAGGDKLTYASLVGKLLIDYIDKKLTIKKMSVTYKPKSKRRKRRHGFIKRSRTKNGRNVLKKRRQKGRKRLTVA